MPQPNESNLDRIVRGVTGTFLLWAASRPFAAGRRRLGRAAIALTGGVLVYTAITGRCGLTTYWASPPPGSRCRRAQYLPPCQGNRRVEFGPGGQKRWPLVARPRFSLAPSD